MPEVKKKRESWLDACKGIAIVLVVIGHIIDGNMSKGLLSGQTWVVVYNVIYLFHMPLFFVLSGMALDVSKRQNLVNGGVKSCLNLLILYLFWQVIYNTLRGVFSSIVNKEAADNLIYELIFPSTLYWYLSALLVYYIVFYLLINRCDKKGLAVVCIIAFIISSFIPFLQEMLKLNGFIYKLLYHFFYFIFGYIVLGHKEKFFEKLGKLFFMPGLSILLIALFIIFDSITQTIPFIKVIFTMAIILGLLFLVIKLKKLQINQIAAYLGRNSIYIYIIHNYITVALRTLYAKSGSNFPSVIYFVLCLIITLTLCTVIQQIVKRLWLLDIFFKPIKVLDKICCKEKEKSENIKV